MAHGHIHWSECVTDDVDAAKAVFGKTAGWSFHAMSMGEFDYHVAMVGDKAVAGIMPRSAMPDPNIPPHWITYVEVADADTAAKAVEESGGTVVRPAFDVPNVGRIVIVSEPGGTVAGLIQPADQG
ncbi:MAG: VOC family protein [Pseudomonadota bacterium]